MKATSDYIVNELRFNGFQTYVVGGAVRDFLMGVESKDVDIATSAASDEIEKIFEDCNIKTVGKSFKVVFVDGIEVATFRTDKYLGLDDKNVEISAVKTIDEDLARRDLTINAMAQCPFTGKIIDKFGGREDLENRIIKFVGDPEKRIYEDPNRIIRACRFLALLNGKFDKDTEKALKKYSYFVRKYVDIERIRIEIMKSMAYKKSSVFFLALHEIGVLKHIFPSLDKCFGHNHGPYHNEDVFTHSMLCGDYISEKNPLLKLAGYLHDIGKVFAACQDINTRQFHFNGHEKIGSVVVKEELVNLRFSNEEIDYVSSLTKLHMRNFSSPRSIRRTLKLLSDCNISYKDLIRLKFADRKANMLKGVIGLSEAKDLVADVKNEINKEPPNNFKHLKLNGNDIMKITGIPQGKVIGDILKFLLLNVVDNPELNNIKTLEQLVFKYLKNGGFFV